MASSQLCLRSQWVGQWGSCMMTLQNGGEVEFQAQEGMCQAQEAVLIQLFSICYLSAYCVLGTGAGAEDEIDKTLGKRQVK